MRVIYELVYKTRIFIAFFERHSAGYRSYIISKACATLRRDTMSKDRALQLLHIERKCVTGNDGKCDRNCADCELVQDEAELVAMYDYTIKRIEESE